MYVATDCSNVFRFSLVFEDYQFFFLLMIEILSTRNLKHAAHKAFSGRPLFGEGVLQSSSYAYACIDDG